MDNDGVMSWNPAKGPTKSHQQPSSFYRGCPSAGTAKKLERLVVFIEHNHLGLTGTGSQERQKAVAQAVKGGLDRHRFDMKDHDFMVPVELLCLARIDARRTECARRYFLCHHRPIGRIAPYQNHSRRCCNGCATPHNSGGRSAVPASDAGSWKSSPLPYSLDGSRMLLR